VNNNVKLSLPIMFLGTLHIFKRLHAYIIFVFIYIFEEYNYCIKICLYFFI